MNKHWSVPSSELRGESNDITGGKTAGRVPASGRGSLPVKNPQPAAKLPPLSTAELIRETQAIVLHFPIKEMADQQGAATRTVESQRNGESAISFRGAVNMCRANPRARAMVARLIGIPGQCSDPDFMEGLEKIVEYYIGQMPNADNLAADCEETPDLFRGLH